MYKCKAKHICLIKIIALGAVCLLLVNTVSWEQPVSNIHMNRTTLAPASIFKTLSENELFEVLAGIRLLHAGKNVNTVNGMLLESYAKSEDTVTIEFLEKGLKREGQGKHQKTTARFNLIGKADEIFEIVYQDTQTVSVTVQDERGKEAHADRPAEIQHSTTDESQHYRIKRFLKTDFIKFMKWLKNCKDEKKIQGKKDRLLKKAKRLHEGLYLFLSQIDFRIEEKTFTERLEYYEFIDKLNDELYFKYGIRFYFWYTVLRDRFLLLPCEILDVRCLDTPGNKRTYEFLFDIIAEIQSVPNPPQATALGENKTALFRNLINRYQLKDIYRTLEGKKFYWPLMRYRIWSLINIYFNRGERHRKVCEKGVKLFSDKYGPLSRFVNSVKLKMYRWKIMIAGKAEMYHRRMRLNQILGASAKYVVDKEFRGLSEVEIADMLRYHIGLHELGHRKFEQIIKSNMDLLDSRLERWEFVSKNEALASFGCIALSPTPFYELLRLTEDMMLEGYPFVDYEGQKVLNLFSRYFNLGIEIPDADCIMSDPEGRLLSVNTEKLEEYRSVSDALALQIFEKLLEQSEKEIKDAARWAYAQLGKEFLLDRVEDDVIEEYLRQSPYGDVSDLGSASADETERRSSDERNVINAGFQEIAPVRRLTYGNVFQANDKITITAVKPLHEEKQIERTDFNNLYREDLRHSSDGEFRELLKGKGVELKEGEYVWYLDDDGENRAPVEIADIPQSPRPNHLWLFIDIDWELNRIKYYEIPEGEDPENFSALIDSYGVNPFLTIDLDNEWLDGKRILEDQLAPIPTLIATEYFISIAQTEQQRERIYAMTDPKNNKYGMRYLRYGMRGRKKIITSWDRSIDVRVFSTKSDTINFHNVMYNAGIFKGDKGFRLALDLGSGNGHLATALGQSLPDLTDLYYSDISPYALRATRLSVEQNTENALFRQHPILGPGLKNLTGPEETGGKFDLIVSNPPYIPTPDFLDDIKKKGTAYGGTELLRDLLEYADEKLNDKNPDAQMLVTLSSITEAVLPLYIAEFGDSFYIEPVGYPKRGPFKIYEVSPEWQEWLLSKGLIFENKNADERIMEKYSHNMIVYRIRKKRSQLESVESDDRMAVIRERLKNLNPERSDKITDTTIKEALREVYQTDEKVREQFVRDFSFGGENIFQVWHSYLPGYLTLADQIRLLAGSIEQVRNNELTWKAVSLNFRLLKEESSVIKRSGDIFDADRLMFEFDAQNQTLVVGYSRDKSVEHMGGVDLRKKFLYAENSDDQYLLAKATGNIQKHRVNIHIDLTVIPDGIGQLEKNMQTIARIIACHDSYNFNTRYILEDDADGDALDVLKEAIVELSAIPGVNKQELLSRIGPAYTGDSVVDIYIQNIDNINKSRELQDSEYVIGLKIDVDDPWVSIPNYGAAASIGLSLAALHVAKRNRSNNEYELLRKKVLKKFRTIFERWDIINALDDFSEDELELMITGSSETKLFYAGIYALPPIIKALIDDLDKYHKEMQLILQAA